MALIEDTDYNSIQTKVSTILGTGSGNSGYGQTVQSSPVAEGQIVTAVQWQNLRYDIYNCLVHQNGGTPSVVNISTGNTIRQGPTHPYTSYDTQATSIVTNKFNLGALQSAEETVGNWRRTADWGGGNYILDIIFTVDFSSANDARYFFNSGGQIIFESTFTPSTSHPQDTSWSQILSSAGEQPFGGNTTVNFYNINSTSYTAFHTEIATATPYDTRGPNSYVLSAKKNVDGNQLLIKVEYKDQYTDRDGATNIFDDADLVQGTLNLYVKQIRATGVLQPAPDTGNFTIAGPTTLPYTTSATTASQTLTYIPPA